MDAIDVLMHDHRDVDRLFERFEATQDASARRWIAQTLINELTIHATIEETHFYPEVRKPVEDGDELVDESLHEHAELKGLLADLDGMMDEPASSQFTQTVIEIKAAVKHHVEEEETELFPRVREDVPADRLEQMARTLEQAKAEASLRSTLASEVTEAR